MRSVTAADMRRVKALSKIDKAAEIGDGMEELNEEMRKLIILETEKKKIETGTVAAEDANAEKRLAAVQCLMVSADKKIQDKASQISEKVSQMATGNGTDSTTVIQASVRAHKAKEYVKSRQMLQFAQTVNVCFVLDATGSMNNGLRTTYTLLTTQLRDILKLVQDGFPNLAPIISLVAYRDPEDRDKHFEITPFTTSIGTIQTAIGAVEPGGGGDECEDIVGALDKAASLDWTLKNKLLFLCGDAPCHGREFHAGCGDHHPDGLGIDIRDVLKRLMKAGVIIVFWKVNDSTDTMIRKFNEIAFAIYNEGVTVPGGLSPREYIKTFDLQVSPTSTVEYLSGMITDSLKETMSASMSRSMSKACATKSVADGVKKVSTLLSIPESDREALIDEAHIGLTEAEVIEIRPTAIDELGLSAHLPPAPARAPAPALATDRASGLGF